MLSSTNASTHFNNEIVKINVYAIIFDKVLHGNLLEYLYKCPSVYVGVPINTILFSAPASTGFSCRQQT